MSMNASMTSGSRCHRQQRYTETTDPSMIRQWPPIRHHLQFSR